MFLVFEFVGFDIVGREDRFGLASDYIDAWEHAECKHEIILQTV